MSNNSDEIDFEPILKSFFSIFKSIFEKTVQLFKFAFKNILFLIIGAFLGGLLAVGTAKLIPSTYKVIMYVSTSSIGEIFLEPSIFELNGMAEDGNAVVLKEKLKLTIDQAENLTGLQASLSSIYYPFKDSTSEEYLYYIVADVKDVGFIDSLQNGLINYLNNNEFVANKRTARVNKLNKSIDRLKLDIESIDQLLKSYSSKVDPSEKTVFKERIEPSELVIERLEQFKLMLRYEEELNEIMDVKVISGFDSKLSSHFPNVKLFTAIGFILGGLIALSYRANKSK